MLSYRHAFHAGNYADVLKHLVQVEILSYLGQKDKPFDYFDTHAGAGVYALQGKHAQTTAEYKDGIAKINSADFPELQDYLNAVAASNPDLKPGQDLVYYPGSPMIAEQFLRKKDRSWLFELHPADLEKLETNFANKRHVRIASSDGFAGLLPLLPPASKRGLVLIDPPYEVKHDYDTAVKTLIAAHKRFSSGTYALWYPVVERARVDNIERKLRNSGIKNIQLFELGREADTEEHGMTAAGMIVINPPWTLHKKMTALLPKLANSLGVDGKGNYRCEIISPE